jgi:hypothetical protein
MYTYTYICTYIYIYIDIYRHICRYEVCMYSFIYDEICQLHGDLDWTFIGYIYICITYVCCMYVCCMDIYMNNKYRLVDDMQISFIN